MAAGFASSSTDTWVWDQASQLYYSPTTQIYAYTDPTTGQWVYLPSSSMGTKSSQIDSGSSRLNIDSNQKEEGEIEDDVGWGGLMEPEELEKVIKAQSKSITQSSNKINLEKHPSYGGGAGTGISNSKYDDPTLYAYNSNRQKSPTPPPLDNENQNPNEILRLVVISSPNLEEGNVAVIDTREGGVQLGRDRCEKGGQVRIRVKEMEISKTHAVVYWSQGDRDEEDDVNGGSGRDEKKKEGGWWVVDLGSTHGTFVTHSTSNHTSNGNKNDKQNDIIDLTESEVIPSKSSSISSQKNKAIKPHRLSETKTSSLPYQLHHLSTIKLGQTIFEVHIHKSWPCDKCQLGKGNEILLDTGEPKPVVTTTTEVELDEWIISMDTKQRNSNREISRKKEMAALRESLINRREVQENNNHSSSSNEMENQNSEHTRKYLDRSAMRSKLHPPSPPRSNMNSNTNTNMTNTQQMNGNQDYYNQSGSNTPPLSIPAGPSLFAKNMLVSQGWTPGSGLGKDLSGRNSPIETQLRNEKRGIGAVGSLAVNDDGEGDWRKRGKMRRYDEMR